MLQEWSVFSLSFVSNGSLSNGQISSLPSHEKVSRHILVEVQLSADRRPKEAAEAYQTEFEGLVLHLGIQVFQISRGTLHLLYNKDLPLEH